jgi:hypothetical protein
MSVIVFDTPNDEEEKELPGTTEEGRIETLKDLVGIYLPNLVDKVTQAVNNKSTELVLTPDLYEDKFTPHYHFHAYTLLGMAVKYVGLHGLKCQITY